LFEVEENGFVSIEKKRHGKWATTLATGSFNSSRPPRARHGFSAICIGGKTSVHLAIWVDGQFAAQADDRTDFLPSGPIGLSGGSADVGPVEIIFDNAVISQVR